jgi:hypothetical protein
VLDPLHAATACDYCLRRFPVSSSASPVACDTCPHVRYCDVACRERAWCHYHRIECARLAWFWLRLPAAMRLAARMLLRQVSTRSGLLDPAEVLASVTELPLPATPSPLMSPEPSYATIWALQSHSEELLTQQGDIMAEYRFYALLMACVLNESTTAVRLALSLFFFFLLLRTAWSTVVHRDSSPHGFFCMSHALHIRTCPHT